MFEAFINSYEQPISDTTANLTKLGLIQSQSLQNFITEGGGGIYANGALSLLSVREEIDNLGGWEIWLPENSQLMGCSAFGTLFLTGGEDLWIIDTQYGQVIESDWPLAMFINSLAEQEQRDDFLHESLYKDWLALGQILPNTSVLCPTPALALGGQFDLISLSIMSLSVYLSFTAQLFEPNSDMPAEVRRL